MSGGTETEGFQPDGSAMDRLAGLAGLGHMVTVDRALLAERDAELEQAHRVIPDGATEAPALIDALTAALIAHFSGAAG